MTNIFSILHDYLPTNSAATETIGLAKTIGLRGYGYRNYDEFQIERKPYSSATVLQISQDFLF